MARQKPRNVITAWTDPVSGIKFHIESDHSLTETEMRERTQWAVQLQSDLRDGIKPLITSDSDADALIPAHIVQARKERQMNPVYAGDPQRITGELRMPRERVHGSDAPDRALFRNRND